MSLAPQHPENLQRRSKPAVQTAVTRLLVSTKGLLESLTQWSEGRVTENDVSDVYVRMGNDFNSTVAAFHASQIDMSDLLDVPERLRHVLESALAEDATPGNLEIYIPEVRAIIKSLLEGLRVKQRQYKISRSPHSDKGSKSELDPEGRYNADLLEYLDRRDLSAPTMGEDNITSDSDSAGTETTQIFDSHPSIGTLLSVATKDPGLPSGSSESPTTRIIPKLTTFAGVHNAMNKLTVVDGKPEDLTPVSEAAKSQDTTTQPETIPKSAAVEAVSVELLRSGTAPISRYMPMPEIIASLGRHSCLDITSQLDLDGSIGVPISTGGFGDVYQARLSDGTLVAIKTVRMFVGSTSEETKHLKDAARELHTWAKCDHPNVVKLLGLAVFRDQISMVSPWMKHGTLPSYLSRHPQADRCQLSTQISKGLAYIHSRGIIHGDLKGLNVLVSEDGRPALTDFGNSTLRDRTLGFTGTTMRSSLSPRWAAPELLNGSGTYSTQADVYALGMTILEAFTEKVPYFGVLEHAIYYFVLMTKEVPKRPNDVIPSESEDGDKLWKLLKGCWAFELKDRPNAASIVEMMRTIKSKGLLKQS